MAEMEGIEQESHEEEKEGVVKEEMGEEGGLSEKEVLELWYKVNREVTLHQPELCAIYTAVHWAWKPDGSPWNDVEIKQIVGHAILGLDEDKYHHLDLTDVIKQFHIEDNDLTKAAKSIAERSKKMLVAWIPQQHEKYLNMCRKDKKLAEQRDNEIFPHQVKQQTSDKTLPEKRRRLEKDGVYGSIAAVPSVSSDRSRDN